MKTDDFAWKASDGKMLYIHRWVPEGKALAVLIIVHGMAEYGLRYAPLAKVMVDRGWTVYAPDHRGHGESAAEGERGWFADHDGFRRVIDDIREIIGEAKKANRSRPVFLFGHCMGALIAQAYSGLYGDKIAGTVWEGIIDEPGQAQIGMGKLFSALGCLVNGQLAKAGPLNRVALGGLNKDFKPVRTAFDWLSRDSSEVDKYVADPLCGFICSYSFFRDLFAGFDLVYGSRGVLASIPKSLPILILSGGADPVGGSRGAVDRLAARLREIGGERIEARLYPGGRHELLNETNRDEVISDIAQWLGNKVVMDAPVPSAAKRIAANR